MHNSMNIHHLPWSFSPFYLLSSSIQESQPGSNTNLAFFKEYLYFATRKWIDLEISCKLQPGSRSREGWITDLRIWGWISAYRRVTYSNAYNTPSMLSRLQKICYNNNWNWLELCLHPFGLQRHPSELKVSLTVFLLLLIERCFSAWFLT